MHLKKNNQLRLGDAATLPEVDYFSITGHPEEFYSFYTTAIWHLKKNTILYFYTFLVMLNVVEEQ